MISKYDDFLIHQTSDPIEVFSSTDPRAFDRFYFNLHDRSGEFVAAFGAGVYPNLDIMDAGIAAVHAGKQHNLRISRILEGADRAETTVGPISFEVLEGLKRWRMTLDRNDYNIAFDLIFEARADVFETPIHRIREGHYYHYDMSHYTQSGRCSGWLEIAGSRWEVTPDRFYSHRDRSWGVRDIARIGRTGRETGGIKRGLHIWAPIQFEDRCVFVYYQEDLDGKAAHLGGAVHYENGRRSAPWVQIEHDIVVDPVTHIHRSGTLLLTDADGVRMEIQTEQLLPGIYLKGMGYDSHGVYKGDFDIAGESWEVDAGPDKMREFGESADQLARFSCNGEKGYGIFEHMVSRNHPRYRRG